ncbi:Uncharacterised protein [Vibrio cholerae]|nr:Uncharacterised protein [Vibrio cholerae]
MRSNRPCIGVSYSRSSTLCISEMGTTSDSIIPFVFAVSGNAFAR